MGSVPDGNSNLTKKTFDSEWLLGIAKDQATKDKIEELLAWNEEVERGEFRDADNLFQLKLGPHTVWFREAEAWFAIHLYEHIFKEKEHLDFRGFDGADAEVVVDLGANIGMYTLAIKTNNPGCRVIAAEPNPKAFELLQKNIEANGLKDVEALNKGVAESRSKFEIKTLQEGSAYGGKYLGDIKKEYRKWIDEDRIVTFEVEAVSLADLFTDFDLQAVDILKMDVEGMELEILRGGKDVLGKIRRIVFEWHDWKTKEEIVKLLLSEGFALVHDDSREYGNLYFENTKALPV